MTHHERSRSTGSRPTLTHRYSAPHPNSSAYSASANANEDWTKISDLAERRRIQNRIAQRNYRKKLKKRLAEIEQGASASPEPETNRDRYSSGRGLPPAHAGTGLDKFNQCSPERFSESPEPGYGGSEDRNAYLPLADDLEFGQTQPSFSYSSYTGSDHGENQYRHSPALSSSYSIPSPALSAVSYDNHNGFLPPAFQHNLTDTSPLEIQHKHEYFDQEYPSYEYGCGSMNDSRRHLSTPLASSTYASTNCSYSSELSETFDSFDDTRPGSPLRMWFCMPTMEDPPLFEL